MILMRFRFDSESDHSAACRKCDYTWHTEGKRDRNSNDFCKDHGDTVRVGIRDTGAGISEETIEKVYTGDMPENKIGLFNVHQRVKLIYGTGLTIQRLDKGTNIF